MIEKIDSHFSSIERTLFGKDKLFEGPIKIAMPGALANHFLIPKMKTFLNEYPKIEIQFLTGPEVVNLLKRDADMAIRLVRPNTKELIIKKIGSISLNLYGHRDYISEQKRQKKQINEFPFIGLFDSSTSELEQKVIQQLKFEPNYQMRSHAWSSVYVAVANQCGIGILPDIVAQQNSNLLPLSENLSKSVMPLWLVIHPDVYNNNRVKVFIDFFSKLMEVKELILSTL